MGPGAIKTIGDEVKKRGIGKVLIVTDKGVIGAGLTEPVEASLKAAGVTYGIFDGVEPDPRFEIVADCVAMVDRHYENNGNNGKERRSHFKIFRDRSDTEPGSAHHYGAHYGRYGK